MLRLINYNGYMKIKDILICILVLAFGVSCVRNVGNDTSQNCLRSNMLDSIIESHRGITGVAVVKGDDVIVAGDTAQLPLMSIFKLHIAIAVLDKGVSVDSVISVDASMLRENTYSPLRDKTGVRDIEISVDSLLYYSVCRSDNNACDILIDLVGGVGRVDSCIRKLGITDFVLTETENSMHEDISRSYNNRSTPEALCRVMEALYTGRALPSEPTAYLTGLLEKSRTGREKIAAGIPAGAFLGHKSGMSDRTNDGIRMATGDVAAFRCGDGSKAYIAILVKDSPEADEESAAIFRDLSSSVFESYSGR